MIGGVILRLRHAMLILCQSNWSPLQLIKCGNTGIKVRSRNGLLMEQSPSSSANSTSARQETPRILWTPKFNYRIYKRPPPVPILSQIETVPSSSSQFSNTHFNIILTFMPRSSTWCLSVRYPHQLPVCTSSVCHACHTGRPSR